MRQNALGLSQNTTAFDRAGHVKSGFARAFCHYSTLPPLFFAEAQFAWKCRCFYTF
jgi:hypothetical protein